MFDDTKAFVQSCDTCQRFAIPRNTGAQGGIVSKFPGDYVAIDMFGKVKEPTKRGNVFGLVIVDLYTKKVVAVGLPDKKPATWVRALEENWIVHESYPRRLLSDRDPSFLAAFAQVTYRVWGTKKAISTTVWNPRGNSEAEAHVNKVKSALKKILKERPGDWDEHLVEVCLKLQSEVNRSTGFSAFFLNHLRDPYLPSDFTELQPLQPDAQSQDVYVTNAMKERAPLFQQVEHSMEEWRAQEKVRRAKKAARIPPREPGSQVLLRVEQNHAGFWTARWTGPYRVLEAPTEFTRRLQLPDVGEYPVVNVQRLRPYHHKQTQLPLAQHEPDKYENPPGFAEVEEKLLAPKDEADRFKVEQIISERSHDPGDADSGRYYHVKWKGYPKSKSTWEPEEYLDHCQEALAEWRKRYPQPLEGDQERLGKCLRRFRPRKQKKDIYSLQRAQEGQGSSPSRGAGTLSRKRGRSPSAGEEIG